MAESTSISILAVLMVISFLLSTVSLLAAIKIQQGWSAYAKELLEFNEKMNRDWAEVLAKLENKK